MPTILVTGGLGFIGSNITTLALKRGYRVIAFDSLKRHGIWHNLLQHKDYRFVHGDVRNPEDFGFIKERIDGIIHLAANPGIPWSYDSPHYDFRVNNLGTFNVLELARGLNVPLIYASTNKVYSDAVNEIPMVEKRTRYVWGKFDKKNNFQPDPKYQYGIPEDFPVDSQGAHPHSPYGVSKYAGDQMCQEWYHAFQVPTVVNRMSCIYGKFQLGVEDQGWVAWFMVQKILGKPLKIFGTGKQVRDALFAEDLAELYLWQLENIDKVKGQVFNIGGGLENTISLLEAIELIDELDRQYSGGKLPKLTYTFDEWRKADHKIFYCNLDKIKPYWKPTTSVSAGFSYTWDWMQRNKDLIERVYASPTS